MATEAESASATTTSGAAQPAGQKAGPTVTADSRNDGGKSDQGSPDRDAIWAEARRHYESEAKKAQAEAADWRKKYEKAAPQVKSAEQIQTELEQARNTLEKQAGVVKTFAESRIEALPEHLRGILTKSAGEDPLKALELLPEFEDLARRTTLKTIGGNQQLAGGVQIDYESIMRESDRGNTAPMRDALKKLETVHGSKANAQTAYNKGLESYMAGRGRR